MPTIDTTAQLTLFEVLRRTSPKGDSLGIAEVLTKTNEILQDAVWAQANGEVSHQLVRRASLPVGTWRGFNEGVAPESSQTVTVVESIGYLESIMEVDVALANMHPKGPAAYRQEEGVAFIEGMSQTLASAVIYGDAARQDMRKMVGLAPRLNAINNYNVVSAGGSGSDLTSIYIVQWGLGKVFMIYPRGLPSRAVQHRDLGEETKVLSDGTMYRVYRDLFSIACGLAVADPRCIARIANIETSGTSNTFNEDLLIQVLNRMPQGGRGATIYVNSTIKTQMEIRLKDKTNVNYTASSGEGLGGEPVLRFRGNRVRLVDAILDTETAIS